MTSGPIPGINRRRTLTGVAAVAAGLPILAACGEDEAGSTGGSGEDTGTPSPSGSESGSGGSAGAVVASTADIEVGGAVFIEDPSIVITQPEEGEFHAFSRTCTHQKCPVTDIQDGKIHCSCHQSLFDMTTGENVGGPAPSPLSEVEITVDGDSITLA
ncbi:Rieske (2Fe-2S) protein [Nocardioides ganghwensis]|jgi:Rieske Fe-S protein|uniref:Cytochrome bc1 complex Rieske iron-sulfur subunit n=1 Tax=Nocardioides ganghwensis TaxID=252230 RepID=A0A4Q2SGR0_9ACTN|nr:Rieske (2Fe-2S) protein [Nocardioides ganghwensis]MBD3946622.1 Rieske (2Fe-2S) protein [Nocardioides ganghwensis]RYC03018.1 Rieske (2Fe-2S) protein [Nocardioides ganghwensis]